MERGVGVARPEHVVTADSRAASVEVAGVSRVFQDRGRGAVHALRGLSFTLQPCTFAVVRGPSGSGKTSLLRIVAALDRPTSGDVVLDGVSYSRASAAGLTRLRRRMGLLFQDALLTPRLPTWENVAYPLIPRGVGRRDRRRAALAALETAGVAELADSPPEVLSGGERQRIGLARALVGAPRLVIADEPTAHLDAATAEHVRRTLTDLTRTASVLVATHDQALAARADVTVSVASD